MLVKVDGSEAGVPYMQKTPSSSVVYMWFIVGWVNLDAELVRESVNVFENEFGEEGSSPETPASV